MRFGLMRVVDKHVGGILCRLLALARWLCRRHVRRVDHPTPPSSDSVREILVVKFLGLGSILQATPLFQALRRKYPEARITLLTFHANRALEKLGIGVDRIVTVDTSSLSRFIITNVKALWSLRCTRFDLLLNLEFFATYAALFTGFLKKHFAMGFGGFANYRNYFFHDFVSYDSAAHVQHKFLAFARRLGYAGPAPALAKLSVDHPASTMAAIQDREKFALATRDYCILVNINTGEMAPHRRWPVEHFRAVIEEILRPTNVRCILIGGVNDRPAVDAFQASLSRPERVINLAGRINLQELVALMQLADLYLGNDSGPLHFAACVGLPVLTVFGPESPEVYGPPVSSRNTVLYRGEPCGPCLNVYTDKHSHCKDNICLKRITPKQVLDVLKTKYLADWGLNGTTRERQARAEELIEAL